ncbi:hypothetical protein chiPu_0031733, partial [Chiloscyllium punctatum]|nr:hypothetical protein [Chiloscyllium punctatum]
PEYQPAAGRSPLTAFRCPRTLDEPPGRGFASSGTMVCVKLRKEPERPCRPHNAIR